MNPQTQAHQQGPCLLTWKSPCLNESLVWDQSFLRLPHFPNTLKRLFSVFLGEEETKLHLHSECETCPTGAWHGLGRRWVELQDYWPDFLGWVSWEVDSEDHLKKRGEWLKAHKGSTAKTVRKQSILFSWLWRPEVSVACG